MNVIFTRILSIIVLFVGTFLFGIFSLPLKKYLNPHITEPVGKAIKFISFLTYFGGGVLFSTCFIHLLPDVRSSFNSYWKGNSTSFDPTDENQYQAIIPELVICSGFLLVYAIEELIHYIIKSVNVFQSVCEQAESSPILKREKNEDYGSITNEEPHYDEDAVHCHITPANSDKISFNGILIVAALSFHSVFEGLSLGLQKDTSETLKLLFAITFHKFLIAFIVGLEILTDGGSLKTLFSSIFIFSIMGPIGIVISILTNTTLTSVSDLVTGILNGIATGTLLYVTFLEVLQKHNNKHLPGLLQFLGVLTGFVVTTVMQIYL